MQIYISYQVIADTNLINVRVMSSEVDTSREVALRLCHGILRVAQNDIMKLLVEFFTTT